MEAGIRTPSEELVKACEDLPQLACNGALAKLHELLAKSLKNHRGAYPGWFAAWPDKEAAAKRLRSFSLVVIDGLLQTDDYARAILSTKVGITPEKLDAFIVADFEDARSRPTRTRPWPARSSRTPTRRRRWPTPGTPSGARRCRRRRP